MDSGVGATRRRHMTALLPFLRKEGNANQGPLAAVAAAKATTPLMNCTGLEGQIKERERAREGCGEFATRVMEDAINNESREKKSEIGGERDRTRSPSPQQHTFRAFCSFLCG